MSASPKTSRRGQGDTAFAMQRFLLHQQNEPTRRIQTQLDEAVQEVELHANLFQRHMTKVKMAELRLKKDAEEKVVEKADPLWMDIPENIPHHGDLNKMNFNAYKRAFGGHTPSELKKIVRFRSTPQKRLLGGLMNYESFMGYIFKEHTFMGWKRQVVDRKFAYARTLERSLLSSVQWRRWFTLRGMLLRWWMFAQWSRKEEATRQKAVKKLVDRDQAHMQQWENGYKKMLRSMNSPAELPAPHVGFQNCLMYLLPHAVRLFEDAHFRREADARQFSNLFLENTKIVKVKSEGGSSWYAQRGRINPKDALLELFSLAKKHLHEKSASDEDHPRDDQAVSDMILAVTHEVDERAAKEVACEDFLDRTAEDLTWGVYAKTLRGRQSQDPELRKNINPKTPDIAYAPWVPSLLRSERHCIEDYVRQYVNLVCSDEAAFGPLREGMRRDMERANQQLEAAKRTMNAEQAEAAYYTAENASLSAFLAEARRMFEDVADRAEKFLRKRMPGIYRNATEEQPEETGLNMGLMQGSETTDAHLMKAKYKTLISAVRDHMNHCLVYDLERLRRSEVHRLTAGGGGGSGDGASRMLAFLPRRGENYVEEEGFGTRSAEQELVPRAFVREPDGDWPSDKIVLQRARHVALQFFRSKSPTMNAFVRTVVLDIARYIRRLWEAHREGKLPTVLQDDATKTSRKKTQRKSQQLTEKIEDLAQIEQFFIGRFLTIYDIMNTDKENLAAPVAMYIVTSANDVLRNDLDNEKSQVSPHEAVSLGSKQIIADRTLAYFVQRFEEHEEKENSPQQVEIEKRARRTLLPEGAPEGGDPGKVLIRLEGHQVQEAVRLLRSMWDECLEEGVMTAPFDSLADLESRDDTLTDEQDAELKLLISANARRQQQLEHYLRELRARVRLVALMHADDTPGEKDLRELDPLWVLMQVLDLSRRELEERGFFQPADRKNYAVLSDSAAVRHFQELSEGRQVVLKNRLIANISNWLISRMHRLPRASPEYDAPAVVEVLFAEEGEEGATLDNCPPEVVEQGRQELERAVSGLKHVVARGSKDNEKKTKYKIEVNGLFYDAYIAQVFNCFTALTYCLHPVVPTPDQRHITYLLTPDGFSEHFHWLNQAPEHRRPEKITTVGTLAGVLAGLACYWTGRPTCNVGGIYERFFELVWQLHNETEELQKVPPVKIVLSCVEQACSLIESRFKYLSRTLLHYFLAEIVQMFAADVQSQQDPRLKRAANHAPLCRLIAFSFLKTVIKDGGDYKIWFNNLHENVPEYEGVHDLVQVLNLLCQCIASPDCERWCERLRQMHNTSVVNATSAVYMGAKFERCDRVYCKGLERYVYFSVSRHLLAARAKAADALEKGLDHNHGFKHETYVEGVGFRKIHTWRAKGGTFFDPDMHDHSNGDWFMTDSALNQGPNQMVSELLNKPPMLPAQAALGLIHFFETTGMILRPAPPLKGQQFSIIHTSDLPSEVMESVFTLAQNCVALDPVMTAAEGNWRADPVVMPIQGFNLHEVFSAFFARVFTKVLVRFPEWRREFPRTLDYLQVFALGVLEYNWKGGREAMSREARLHEDAMKFAQAVKKRGMTPRITAELSSMEDMIVNAEDFATIMILSGSGYINKGAELEGDREAGLVNFDEHMQKDLARLAVKFCGQKEYAELFLCFVAMAFGRRVLYKHRQHYNSLLCYFFLNMCGEYLAIVDIPMYKWLEQQIRRIFAVAQRPAFLVGMPDDMYPLAEDEAAAAAAAEKEKPAEGEQAAEARLGFTRRRQRWSGLWREFDDQALAHRQEEQRALEKGMTKEFGDLPITQKNG